MRDCTNICDLVPVQGAGAADEHELFGDLMAHAF